MCGKHTATRADTHSGGLPSSRPAPISLVNPTSGFRSFSPGHAYERADGYASTHCLAYLKPPEENQGMCTRFTWVSEADRARGAGGGAMVVAFSPRCMHLVCRGYIYICGAGPRLFTSLCEKEDAAHRVLAAAKAFRVAYSEPLARQHSRRARVSYHQNLLTRAAGGEGGGRSRWSPCGVHIH